MLGIHAGWIFAEMKHRQAGRNRASGTLKEIASCVELFPATSKIRILSCHPAAGPNPTGSPKPFRSSTNSISRVNVVALPKPAFVVAVDESLRLTHDVTTATIIPRRYFRSPAAAALAQPTFHGAHFTKKFCRNLLDSCGKGPLENQNKKEKQCHSPQLRRSIQSPLTEP